MTFPKNSTEAEMAFLFESQEDLDAGRPPALAEIVFTRVDGRTETFRLEIDDPLVTDKRWQRKVIVPPGGHPYSWSGTEGELWAMLLNAVSCSAFSSS